MAGSVLGPMFAVVRGYSHECLSCSFAGIGFRVVLSFHVNPRRNGKPHWAKIIAYNIIFVPEVQSHSCGRGSNPMIVEMGVASS